MAGALVGIGAQLDAAGGKIRVVTPLEDSPALNAGVQAGDMIVQIDGQSTEGLALTEAVKRIVGPAGTTVRLKLARGEKDVEIGVVRGPIRVASVKGIVRGTDNRWSFLLDAGQKIGYLQLTQLGSNTPQECELSLNHFRLRV